MKEEIHYGTLEVLNETGVFVEDEAALNCFEEGGAVVDRDLRIVKIPPYVVEEAIRSAPPKVVLHGRDPKNDIVLESTRVHFTNFSEGVMVNDPYTGENRPPVKQDLVDSARVIDYLEEIDFCEKALGAHDVDRKTVPLHNAEVLSGITLAQLTRKGTPVIYGSSTTAMDLRLASASVGTPECAVISGAVARLARYYALPSYVAGQ